ncbi:MAG TPA: hypothetical protein VFA51_05420 [Candidatus Udaeobacter sp.]|nr:hypothetical protein [Candidatus Udaeobacter sp.]
MKDHQIDRLLRSASKGSDQAPAEMPFGFDTRVIAQWRKLGVKPNGISSLLRRVALLSSCVIIISTLAAIRELKQSQDQSNDFTNEFAIADTAIQDGLSQ